MSAVHWVPLAESDALELVDPVSRRSTVVVRPPDDVLAMDHLVRLEQLGFAWCNVLTQHEADVELKALEPLPVLTGLNWILALWCVACEVDTGISAADGARTLDYRGGWRTEQSAGDEAMWNALAERARIGVLAALTEDDRAVDAYRRAAIDPPPVTAALLRYTVLLFDGFSQDMMGNQLNPKGLVASFAAQTRPTASPRRCFRPSTVPS